MKNFKLWHLALICVAVFLIFGTIATVVILNNSNLHSMESWNFGWKDSNSGLIFGAGKDYSIDEQEYADVKNKNKIEIYTVSSDINIVQSEKDELSVHLYGDYSSKNGEIELEISETGSQVKVAIKYPNSGVTRSNTTLDIEIPKSYTGDLSLNGVSSDIELDCDDMEFEKLSASTVSGQIYLNTVSAEVADISSTSGDLKGYMLSGRLNFSGVSSKVDVAGLTSESKISTVSGDVTLTVKKYDNIEVDTTSGNTKIILEDKGDFYVKYDSVSGDFECDVPMKIVKQKGGDFEGYSGEDYEAKFDVDSVSGDLSIILRS